VPYQTATVQILDGDSLEVVDCSGPVRDGYGPGTVHPLRDHPRYRRILEQGEPELIACPVDEIPELPRGVRADRVSWIGVPLGAQGSIIGILTLASVDHDAFTPEHLSLTSSIGDYVALAIQNAQLFEEARRAAITDPLTGAYTRYWFIPYVEREIDAALRDSKPLYLIVIDVDHFKDLNDTYGHPAGDVVLTDLVRTLSGELRASNPLCRLGGEEFAVLLPDVEPEAAVAVAERLRAAAAGLAHACCPDRNVTISLGIAGLSTECRDYDSLFAGGDRALYHAKASGRNCARTYESLPQSSR
jgi:diguanylate cyclase (GGDEF)-like protein